MTMKKKLALTAAGAALAIPMLIGGKIAEEGDYPSIVRTTSQNGSGCTAAVVGPNVLLIAAHCVGDGKWVQFNGKRSQPCTHHPDYADKYDRDFALCIIPTTPAPYSVVNTDHNYVKKGDTLLLTGYGCTRVGGGGADGKLRIGEAPVTGQQGFYIITKAPAALCYGDSGGPAYKGAVLVGVNSRGNIADTSYLSAVHLADEKFFKVWAEKNGGLICGLTTTCGEPERETPPEVPPSNLWMEILLWFLGLFAK